MEIFKFKNTSEAVGYGLYIKKYISEVCQQSLRIIGLIEKIIDKNLDLATVLSGYSSLLSECINAEQILLQDIEARESVHIIDYFTEVEKIQNGKKIEVFEIMKGGRIDGL